jgi:hypothetical protein
MTGFLDGDGGPTVVWLDFCPHGAGGDGIVLINAPVHAGALE